VCGIESGGLLVWDLTTRTVLASLRGSGREEIRACGFAAGGAQVIACNNEAVIKIWRWASNTECIIQTGATSALKAKNPFATPRCQAAAFSEDGTLLLIVTNGGTLIAWNTEEDREHCLFGPCEGRVISCAISPTKDLAATVTDHSSFGKLTVWQLATGKAIGEFHSDPNLTGLTWRPDGKHLALGDAAGRLHLFHLENVAHLPPLVNPWRRPGADGLAVGCVACHTWSEIDPSALGTTWPCANCREEIRIAASAIEADWQDVAIAWKEQRGYRVAQIVKAMPPSQLERLGPTEAETKTDPYFRAYVNEEYRACVLQAYSSLSGAYTLQILQVFLNSMLRLGLTHELSQIGPAILHASRNYPWQNLLLKLTLRQVDLPEALRDAGNASRRCQVHYYAGALSRSLGNLDAAREQLDLCADLDARSCLEWRLALAERSWIYQWRDFYQRHPESGPRFVVVPDLAVVALSADHFALRKLCSKILAALELENRTPE
jgi:hypothetical protein